MSHHLRCIIQTLALAMFAPDPTLAAAVSDTRSPTAGSYCPLEQSADWEGCIDQQVEIRGRIPAVLQQHPMLAAPAFGDGAAEIQSYLETSDGIQVILLSASESACTGALLASGTLAAIRMDGADGSKLSYQGWALRGAEIRCLDEP